MEFLSLLKNSAPVWRCARRNLDGIFENLSKILPQLSIEGENESFYYGKTEPHMSAYVFPLKRNQVWRSSKKYGIGGLGTKTFDMEGLEMASEVHDAKELGAEVFHIEELA